MKLSKKKLLAATGVITLLLGLLSPTAQVFVTSVMNAAIRAAPPCNDELGIADHCLEE